MNREDGCYQSMSHRVHIQVNLQGERHRQRVRERKAREGFECLKSFSPASPGTLSYLVGTRAHLFSIESNGNYTVIYFHVFKPLRVKYPRLRAHQCIPMREEV